jgi:benzoyl-CoA reductase/2-hydroxyglutaryl-CoA dehydratase subunit BcrC/BadD/HgdB
LKGRIGFTTTIPVEILFASGHIPCDLNNLFITDEQPMRYIGRAERDGFPKSMCNWVKGIYGVIMEKGVDEVLTVMEGDCSNTRALAEILQYRGVQTFPFSYPYDRDEAVLKREIQKFMAWCGVTESTLAAVEKDLAEVRSSLESIDTMTWQDGLVTGAENHLWLVRASDMMGDYRQYGSMAKEFIERVKGRAASSGIEIGYIGVPPIITDLYEYTEGLGTRVVYNETQRQSSLPFRGRDIVDRYLFYTYPYGVFARLPDIKQEIATRRIKGIIHYVQAFCFRAMEEVIFRETLGVPILTIEGDLPKPLDTRTKLRIEAFVEVLKGRLNGES